MCKILGIIILGLIAVLFLSWFLYFPVRGFIDGLFSNEKSKNKKESIFDGEDYIFVPMLIGTIVFFGFLDFDSHRCWGFTQAMFFVGPLGVILFVAWWCFSILICYACLKIAYYLFFLLGFFVNIFVSFLWFFIRFLRKSW